MKIRLMVELDLSDRQFTRDQGDPNAWAVDFVEENLAAAGKRHLWRPQVVSVEPAS